LSSAGGRLIISSDGVWDALTAEMAFNCTRGLPPDAAADRIVKVPYYLLTLHIYAHQMLPYCSLLVHYLQEAVASKGLRDDTTCIVIDIIPPEKPKCAIESPKTPGKGLGLLRNLFIRKVTSDIVSLPDKEIHAQPDLVEEVFEDGCPSLSRRFVPYPILMMHAQYSQ
jgi:hypothetical protein